MKCAVFGDVHANLEALTAVLADARSEGAEEFVCTGDVVGYNPNPRECIQLIRDLGCPVVLGNHDEEAARDEAIYGMNPLARTAIEWTRAQLTPDEKQWLRALPLAVQVHGFTVVHASLDEPPLWTYVLSRFDALCSFSHQRTAVCFHGHTHRPRFFVQTGQSVREEDPAKLLRVVPGNKYFLNTGSVGCPRDGDRRAAYAIYDRESAGITLRRVEWDYESCEQSLRRTPMWTEIESRRRRSRHLLHQA
jgi:predicted phosphodiesterase